MRGHFPLARNDHSDVHHHKLVAWVHLSSPPVRDERRRVCRVVHVCDVSVGGELHELVAWSHTILLRLDDAQVDQGRLVSTSSEADEHLGGAEAAMVEVCRLLGRGEVDQLIRVRGVLAQPWEDHRDVGDRVLVVTRLQAHLNQNRIRYFLYKV